MKRRVVAILSMALMSVSLAAPAQAASPCLPSPAAEIVELITGDGWPPCVNP